MKPFPIWLFLQKSYTNGNWFIFTFKPNRFKNLLGLQKYPMIKIEGIFSGATQNSY
jgi:hypothetical protein